jgi:hypothetical protein
MRLRKGMERDTLKADSDLLICVAVNFRVAAFSFSFDLDLKPGSIAN